MSDPNAATLVGNGRAGAGYPACVGRPVAGRYVILEEVGRGGMGCVYRAYDSRLRREVALKTLHAVAVGVESDGETLAGRGHRLLREAQAMARLSHPNVLPVFDVDRVDGTFFVAMEYVEGEHLGEWLARKPRTTSEILGVFEHAGRGLQAAHAAGLIHRDFKPSNVLVGADGRVRVMDFGLVLIESGVADGAHGSTTLLSRVAEHEGSERLTVDGAVVGTPAYMPPEQHFGDPQDARSDQFSFCVALHHALTGKFPFSGRDLATLCRAKQSGSYARPTTPRRDISPAAWSAILRGLSAEPSRRWPSLQPLLDALRPRRLGRRKQWAIAGAVAMAAGLAAIMVSADAPACDPALRLANAWTVPQRDELAHAFAGTDAPFAQATAGRVADGLDEWASQWSAAYASTCESRADAAAHPAADARLACLERQRLGLRAAVGVLTDAPDAAVVERAARIADALPAPAACASIDPERSQVPDASQLAAIAALDDDLARVDALRLAGRSDQAAALADQALAQAAGAITEVAALQRAHLAAGRSYDAADRYDEAEAALERAFHLAVNAALAPEAADAAIELAGLVGDRQRRPQAGLTWSRHAQDWIDVQQGAALLQHARLETMRGLIHIGAHEPEAALAQLERALQLTIELEGPATVAVADALAVLGRAERLAGHDANAVAHAREALTLRRHARGDDHPDTALSWVDLGAAHETAGALEDARLAYGRAIAIYSAIDADHPALRTPIGRLAGVLAREDDLQGAGELARRSLALAEATLGPAHPAMIEHLSMLAAVQTRAKQWPEAIGTIERALGLMEADAFRDHAREVDANVFLARGLEDQDRHAEAVVAWAKAVEAAVAAKSPPGLLAYLRLRLGNRRLDLGRPELALGDLQAAHQAWEGLPAAQVAANLVAETDFALARARWLTGGDPADALRLARRSRERWIAAVGIDDGHVAQIDGWVAAVTRDPSTESRG